MKKQITLLAAICLIALGAFAQSITLIPNLNPSDQGYMGGSIVFDNNLYIIYETGGIAQLAQVNGTSISLIANPDAGYGLEASFIYNNNLYFQYINASGSYQLAKFDGSSMTLIPNPDASSYGFESPSVTVYNGDLYFGYYNSSGINQLAKYDGNSVSLITNPDAGYGYYGLPIVHNGNLYFEYYSSSYHVQLAKYNGSSISLIANPGASDYGPDGTPVVYNSDLYFSYYNSSNKSQLAQYNGSSISLIPNINASDAGMPNQYNPIVFNNILYFTYAITPGYNQLAQYNGSSLSLVPNLSNTSQGVISAPFIYDNDLYFEYAQVQYVYQLAQYDGSNINLIADPNAQGGGVGHPIVWDNDLYYTYNDNNSYSYHVAQYDGSSVSLLTNPDAGAGNEDDYIVYNGNLYFQYTNVSGEYQLAEICTAPVISSQASTAVSGDGFSYTPTGSINTGTTYAWSVPSGSGFSGGTSGSGQYSLTGTLTATVAGSVTAVYTVTPTSGACTGSAFTISVAISSVDTWTGALSSAWGTAGNWTSGVPTSTTDAVIAAAARNPVISSSSSSRNITVQSGASLTISSGQTLSVYGNLANSGTASLGTGTVSLNGSADTLFGTTTLGGLTVASTVQSVLDGTARVTGQMDLVSGTLYVPGQLTMVSTASQTAYIENNNGVPINGNVDIQRYVGGHTGYGYHHISSPLAGATLANLSGVTISGTNGINANTAGREGTLENYVEATNTTSDLKTGYWNYTTLSNPLSQGMGLAANISAGTTITFIGTPTSGPVYRTITSEGINATTRGWNFVGNPYPAPVSWTAIKGANSNLISGTCYIYVPSSTSTGSWEEYNGGTGVGSATDIIAVGQGFFILFGGAYGQSASLTFSNSMQYYSLTPPYYKTNLLPDEVRLTLTSPTESAEAVSYTEAGRTAGYDADVDGLLPPAMGDDMNATSVAFASQGQDYLINVTDAVSDNTVMPLAIHTTTAGSYTLSAKALNVSAYPVYLLDKATNTYYDLASQNVTFTSAGNEDKNNYSVVFKKVSGQSGYEGFTLETLYPNPATSQVSVGVVSGANVTATLTMTDVLGREVFIGDWPLSIGDNNSSLDISGLADGAYTVTIRSGSVRASGKLVITK